MADGVQGLTGGLASALTPGIGIPVALLGAAAGAWFQSWQENNEKVKEEISEWVQAFVDGSGKIQEARIMTGVQDYLADSDKMAEAQKLVTATGLSQQTVLRALNGDLTDAATVTSTLADKKAALADLLERARNGEQGLNVELLKGNAALGEGGKVWDAHAGALDEAAKAYDVYSAAASTGLTRTADAAVAAGKATKSVDEFGDTLVAMPDGKTIYIDAETGQATEDTDAIERKIFSIQDKTVNVKVNADMTGANAAFDALQRRVSRGIDIAFNNSGRQLLQ